MAHAQPRGDVRRHLRQRLAAAQRVGAVDVRRKIEVAEAKPRIRAQSLERAEGAERLVFKPPPHLVVGNAGERVGDGVHIG